MSRSVKKSNYQTDISSYGKEQARRRVRRFYKDKDFVDTKGYDKKIYEQWAVKGYGGIVPTYEEFKNDSFYNPNGITNEKILKRKYHKMYINK